MTEVVDKSQVRYGPNQICPACGKAEPKWCGLLYWYDAEKGIEGSDMVINGWAMPENWMVVSAGVPKGKRLRKEVCSSSCGVVELKKFANSL